MIFKISEIFNRGELKSNYEIIKWWNKGRGILNLSLMIYTLIHLSLIVLLFNNGWIIFLIPIILVIFILINLIYSIGLVTELALSRLFKLKIDFNKVAPEIKRMEIALIILIVLSLSIFDILNQ